MVIGIYLTVVSMALFYGGTSTLLSLVALMLLLGFPGVLFVIERRYHRSTGGCADISAMWLLGLVSTAYSQIRQARLPAGGGGLR